MSKFTALFLEIIISLQSDNSCFIMIEKIIRGEAFMKIIDCEFHYYLPELMEYLSTRDNAMKYYPETKI